MVGQVALVASLYTRNMLMILLYQGVCVYVCVCVCACVHACMHVCVGGACMCVFVYICMPMSEWVCGHCGILCVCE